MYLQKNAVKYGLIWVVSLNSSSYQFICMCIFRFVGKSFRQCLWIFDLFSYVMWQFSVLKKSCWVASSNVCFCSSCRKSKEKSTCCCFFFFLKNEKNACSSFNFHHFWCNSQCPSTLLSSVFPSPPINNWVARLLFPPHFLFYVLEQVFLLLPLFFFSPDVVAVVVEKERR